MLAVCESQMFTVLGIKMIWSLPCEKNHLWGQILYKNPDPPKNGVIVFIHGLGGSVASTWCTDDTEYADKPTGLSVNWLDRWVTRDLQRTPGNVRILGIDYETAIIFDSHQCPHNLETRTLQERAKSGKFHIISNGKARETQFSSLRKFQKNWQEKNDGFWRNFTRNRFVLVWTFSCRRR